jgi:hypothetical protein
MALPLRDHRETVFRAIHLDPPQARHEDTAAMKSHSNPLVGVIMAANQIGKPCGMPMTLTAGGPHECRIVSAHHTIVVAEYAAQAEVPDLKPSLEARAAHSRVWPPLNSFAVLGVPVERQVLKGVDSCLHCPDASRSPGGHSRLAKLEPPMPRCWQSPFRNSRPQLRES